MLKAGHTHSKEAMEGTLRREIQEAVNHGSRRTMPCTYTFPDLFIPGSFLLVSTRWSPRGHVLILKFVKFSYFLRQRQLPRGVAFR